MGICAGGIGRPISLPRPGQKIIRGKEFGEPVVLWGDGNQKRELVYVADFVDILIRLSGSVKNEIVNIGAGEEHSIRFLANLICEIVGFPPEEIAYDTTRYVGAVSKCLNVGKLKSLLGEYRLTRLHEGIARARRRGEWPDSSAWRRARYGRSICAIWNAVRRSAAGRRYGRWASMRVFWERKRNSSQR